MKIEEYVASKLSCIHKEIQKDVYWLAIQIKDYGLDRYLYVACGAGYELSAKDESLSATQKLAIRMRELYRGIPSESDSKSSEKARLFDEVLFGRKEEAGKQTLKYPPEYRVSKKFKDARSRTPKILKKNGKIHKFCYNAPVTSIWDDNGYPLIDENDSNGVRDWQIKVNSYLGEVCAKIDWDHNLLNLEQVRNGDVNMKLLIGGILCPWDSIIYSRIENGAEDVLGGVSIATKSSSKISDAKIKLIISKLKILAIEWMWRISNSHRELANVKSAIGSIMSRNGSHNIGSHVLAALSHNVGTMPDDRVLYQYIQQRMDYIANVTTESPSWAQPTMLVGELMRTFLSQRHLLGHIAESEGLSAWEFQSRNSEYDDAQTKKIKIYVRKVKRNNFTVELLHDFIKYANNEVNNKIDLSHDVALAIPGGVAGQHAFFTILENIIRNAAKHDWSNPPPRTKHIKESGNLELHIDFEDKEETGQVEFNIWTNMSDVLEDPSAGDDVGSEKALHNQLARKLAVPFIDGSGSLRRANWGLAEMKISVGYLQGRRIAEIGGIKENFKAKDIIDPQYIEDQDVKHLVYRFCVPKPKMMLFLLKDDTVPREWKKYESLFAKHGIYAKTYSEVKDEARVKKLSCPRLDYEYVIMDDMEETEANWFLPFRVMTIAPTMVDGAKGIITTVKDRGWDPKSCAAILNSMLLVAEDKTIEDRIREVVDKILARWCKFMKSRHMKSGDEMLGLILTVREGNNNDGENAGRGLISKGDIVAFVIREALHSTIASYIALNRLDVGPECEKHKAIIEVLDRLKGRPHQSLGTKIDMSDVKGETFRPYIQEWLKQMLGGNDCGVNSAVEELRQKIKLLRMDNSIPDDEKKYQIVTLRNKITQLNTSLSNGPVNQDVLVIDGFIDYMVQVCSQMESVLCKYAENIASLPKGFGVELEDESDDICEEWVDANLYFWKGARNYDSSEDSFTDAERSRGFAKASSIIKSNPIIEFVRHYDPSTEDLKENQRYAEPLSGSQSYLNVLERCTCDDKRTIARLLETASLRILVIDERVAKFYREHGNEIARTYRSMHIYVADDKKVDDELQLIANQLNEDSCEHGDRLEKLKEERWQSLDLKTDNEGLISLSAQNIFDGRKVIDSADSSPVEGHDDRLSRLIAKFTDGIGKKLFDVLIIHQGIIDKWFPGTANDSKRVEKLLNYLRQIFPYVVITTGRGSPANIPDIARMVPFSTIENTLFRKYPEKMLLVDAIMNVLPKGATANE